jgi:predicted tellurium resistance membrane protein TerC
VELYSFDNLFTVSNLVALLTLALLEIVLGIDNVVFISIISGKLPPEQRPRARKLGLAAAVVTRILLLFTISWIMRLREPLFHVPLNPLLYELGSGKEHLPLGISGQDLILLVGGLFLIGKATVEIHHKMDGGESPAGETADPQRLKGGATLAAVLVQIMLIDVVFSLDSVITAVGMVGSVWVMIAAVLISVGVMIAFVNKISDFVERHPTIKMLALAFLILIGVLLVAEGVGRHIERGYIYFAMVFSLLVEVLNMRTRKGEVKKGDPAAVGG